MLVIKAETSVNFTGSTIKQTQENLNTGTVWVISEEEKFRLHTEELKKLRRAKDERNATAHPVQKASIDKVKEEKMNFETIFTQSFPVALRSRGHLVLNYLKQHSNILWNEQGQMIYKDDVKENSRLICSRG